MAKLNTTNLPINGGIASRQGDRYQVGKITGYNGFMSNIENTDKVFLSFLGYKLPSLKSLLNFDNRVVRGLFPKLATPS